MAKVKGKSQGQWNEKQKDPAVLTNSFLFSRGVNQAFNL